MKNIERRGERFRAQIYCRGVRLSKTFGSAEAATAWVETQKEIVAAHGRLERSSLKRRRLDYAAITFGRAGRGDLLSAAEILAAAVSRGRVCGVYFLIAAGKIMYVGQSTDAHYRVSCHAQSKAFDGYHVIPCGEAEACLLESRYIVALNPPWNRGRNGGVVLSVSRDALNIPV